MKKVKVIHDLLKNKDYTKSIKIFFATKIANDDFDEYSQNYEYTNLNPVSIRGTVTYLSPQKATYKLYGRADQSFVEVITDAKYTSYFEQANKIEIDGNAYVVLRDKVGSGAGIQPRSNDIIRVVLERR